MLAFLIARPRLKLWSSRSTLLSIKGNQNCRAVQKCGEQEGGDEKIIEGGQSDNIKKLKKAAEIRAVELVQPTRNIKIEKFARIAIICIQKERGDQKPDKLDKIRPTRVDSQIVPVF